MRREKALGVLLAILAFSMFIVNVFAIIPGISPEEEWSRRYGGTYNDQLYSVQQTSDGGYILAGCTMNLEVTPWLRILLVKSDPQGNMQWNKAFVVTNQSWAVYAKQTSDGGYMVISGSERGVLLLKTDPSGVGQWNTTYGIGSQFGAVSAAQTIDGGYVIVGVSWLMKVDSVGNMEWNETLDGSDIDRAMWVEQTSDGGYVVSGNAAGSGEALLVKVNSDGHIQWNRMYSSFKLYDYYTSNCILETSDGGFVMGGFRSPASSSDVVGCIVKTYSDGNVEWNKTYGNHGFRWIGSICKAYDGGYMIGGLMFSDSYDYGNPHFLVGKIDSEGGVEWKKIVGPRASIVCSVQQTSDGGYIFTGTAQSYDMGRLFDLWVTKLSRYVSPVTVTVFVVWVVGMAFVAVASIALISKAKIPDWVIGSPLSCFDALSSRWIFV